METVLRLAVPSTLQLELGVQTCHHVVGHLILDPIGWLICIFKISILPKGFSFLYQCFAQLRFWKSVSSKTAVAPASRFRESETLFQNRSCAKH